MTDIISLDKTYVANTYGRFPVEVSHGKGSLLYDVNGKEYTDVKLLNYESEGKLVGAIAV